MSSVDDRQKAIDVAVSQIEDVWQGAIMRLGEGAHRLKSVISAAVCRSIWPDWGVARGRIVEIFGPSLGNHPCPAHHR